MFLGLYATLTTIYFVIFLFTSMSQRDFTVVRSVLLVIAGTILGCLVTVIFVGVRGFPVWAVLALAIGFYFVLLIKDMMVKIGGGRCGCGLNISKKSTEWPIAVVQLFFFFSIAAFVVPAFVVTGICNAFCGDTDNESEDEVRVRTRREQTSSSSV